MTADAAVDVATVRPPSAARLLPFVAVGGAVALAAGVYADVHDPTYQGITTFGFRAVLPMKAWFTTAATALVIVQIVTALQMWGRLPSPVAPHRLQAIHRWSGTVAFLFTIPVAYHCLWALGLDTSSTRTLVHGVVGCAFYGAFTTKMLVLRSTRVPSWSIPVIGGVLVALLTALWLTSSLWYFTNVGFPGT
jgi:Family of unknown function (DUF6529)